eukprot:1251054-Prymnesium_polylepis.1
MCIRDRHQAGDLVPRRPVDHWPFSREGRPRRADAQHHGNRMGTAVRDYAPKDSQLRKTANRALQRLRAKGKPTDGWDEAVKAAAEQLYVCPYGGTPQNIAQPRLLQTSWAAADASETARDLADALSREREEHTSTVHDLTRA